MAMRHTDRSFSREVDWPNVAMLVFIAAMIVLVLSGLGYGIWYAVNDPGQGTITGRHYMPGYSQYSCMGTPGQPGYSCANVYYPECYDIKYTDGHHNGDKCVAPQDWNKYQVGGQYP